MAQSSEIKSNPISKYQQKRAIKKKYAKTYRTRYKSARTTIKVTAKKSADFVTKTVAVVAKNPKVIVIILIAMFLVFIISSVSSSIATFTQGVLNSFVSSSYTSEDEELLKIESKYVGFEDKLQEKINNIENDYPGYDEYRYNLAEIGHNPHDLASYLTVLYQYFIESEVTSELEKLFDLQYDLSIMETVETRYKTETRTKTWTDEDGNTYTDTYTVQVPYDYKILNVTLENKSIDAIASQKFNDEQLELYYVYKETKGNKPDLFPDNMESNIPPLDYKVPGNALTDPEFAALIQEAEKYIGMPYTWGGRTTAQGIFNQSAVVSPSEAKPGDIIFFQGTYNTSDIVTHVGIYVGDGMMVHAGDPIGYANINSNFWSSHFYAFGRLNTK